MKVVSRQSRPASWWSKPTALTTATATVAIAAAVSPHSAVAQTLNFARAPSELQEILRASEWEILRATPSRGTPGERTQQLTVQLPDSTILLMKYAPATPGADEFNNQPRFEIGAYEVQKLYLNEDDYVVPPTVARAYPIEDVRAVMEMAGGEPDLVEETWREWPMTLVVLQYWLLSVSPPDDLRDLRRDADRDGGALALRAANFNLLTYLIGHNDANQGNYLISSHPDDPVVFSVDNGVAFSSFGSNRRSDWRRLILEKYPQSAADRLREVTLDDLHARLGVLAEFRLIEDRWRSAEPGANMNPGRGIRVGDSTIQLGLSDDEIEQVFRRVTEFVEGMDSGRWDPIP